MIVRISDRTLQDLLGEFDRLFDFAFNNDFFECDCNDLGEHGSQPDSERYDPDKHGEHCHTHDYALMGTARDAVAQALEPQEVATTPTCEVFSSST